MLETYQVQPSLAFQMHASLRRCVIVPLPYSSLGLFHTCPYPILFSLRMIILSSMFAPLKTLFPFLKRYRNPYSNNKPSSPQSPHTVRSQLHSVRLHTPYHWHNTLAVDTVAADSTCPAVADSPAGDNLAMGSLAVVDIRLVGNMAVVADSARRSSLVRAVGPWVGGMDRRLGGWVEDSWEVGRSPEVCVSIIERVWREGEIQGVRTYLFDIVK